MGSEMCIRDRYNESQLKRGERTFGAGMGFMGGGQAIANVAPPQNAGLDPINGHMLPLAAATTTVIAGDAKGDVFHALVHAQAATGSWYGEIVATRDGLGNTAHVVAWETPMATAPNLVFSTGINAVGNVLELSITSDINIDMLRGKIIYV